MRNRILENIDELKISNYVRKTDPSNKYWGDFSANKLENYLSKLNTNFNLIVYGDPDDLNDYYLIPYTYLREYLIPEYYPQVGNNSRGGGRWIFTISNHNLKISNCPVTIPVASFYGVSLDTLIIGNEIDLPINYSIILSDFLENVPDPNRYYQRYITSLISKPFVIITGNSGTGKTRIAKILARWLTTELRSDKAGDENRFYAIVPVGSNWIDNKNVIGYFNPLIQKFNSTPILDILIEATDNPSRPYFLILDEMNLSHVERYFSDFLSAMESGEPLYLHQESKSVLSNSGKMIPTELKIPKNIFITGTVNIDETTYMFSPKVLDRSNVIEFSINKEMINNFTKNGFIEKEIIPADEKIIDYFLDLSIKLRNKSQSEFPLSISEVDEINESIVNLYTILEDSSQEFAFRTIDEIFRYIRASKQIDPERNITDFLDEQILQKILPKLHGNRRKMEKILFNLLYYTENHKLNPNDEIIYMQNENSNSNKPIFPASNQKIKKMIKSLKNDGFVSYIQ